MIYLKNCFFFICLLNVGDVDVDVVKKNYTTLLSICSSPCARQFLSHLLSSISLKFLFKGVYGNPCRDDEDEVPDGTANDHPGKTS